MNGREKVAVALLTVTFLIGTAISWIRRPATSRQPAVAVVVDSTAYGVTPGLRGAAGIVDLNAATPRELEALPGVGPVIAARIVAYRDRVGGFTSVGELRKVGGIGPKRYSELRSLVGVGSGRSPDTAR
jgi:competence ComEA-like helix-hairpin-helix protein